MTICTQCGKEIHHQMLIKDGITVKRCELCQRCYRQNSIKEMEQKNISKK